MPCLNEVHIGGFSECSAPIKSMDMCPYPCKYYIEDKIEELYESKDYMAWINRFYKTSWNEPKHRCYEGIPESKKIPKTHKDEWDWKRYWEKRNVELMVEWLGPIWCKEYGII